MLDLDARVHLDEVERPVAVEQELDRAGVLVAHCGGDAQRGAGHGVTRVGVERRRRRLLEQLLPPALERALALEKVDQVAVRVAEHLHLDVTRVDEHLLEVQRPVAERGVCLHRGLREELGELLLGARGADPPPTSAGGGLDQHRVADLACDLERLFDRGRTLGAGNRRCPRPRRESPRGDLVAHRLDRLRTGADEDQPLVAAGGREVGVLGEEAVPGVDGVGARLACRLEHRLHVQVALAGVRRPDADRLVGAAYVQCILDPRSRRRRPSGGRARGTRGSPGARSLRGWR